MPTKGTEIDIRHLVHIVLRQKKIVAGTVLAAVVLSIVYSFLQTTVYTSSAQVILNTPEAAGVGTASAAYRDPARRLATQIQLFKSTEVAKTAAKKLDGKVSPGSLVGSLSITNSGAADILTVSATDSNPSLASAKANAATKAFVDYSNQQSNTAISKLLESIAKQRDTAKAEFDQLDSQLRQSVNSSSAPSKELSDIQPRRDAAFADYTDLRRKYDALEAQSTLQSQSASIVEPALTPTSPSSPKPVRNTILAAFIGLLLGVGLAFVKDRYDDKIRSPLDLEALTDTPLLGIIPKCDIEAATPASGPKLLTGDPTGFEAFRRLRTNFQYVTLGKGVHSIGMVSARPNDGKTTITANLAACLAQSGLKVILIGADMHKPALHRMLRTSNEVGLSSVLTGTHTLAETLQPITFEGTPTKVWFLSAGPKPPNHSELLGQANMAQLLAELKQQCDFVILDLPPILAVSDALVIGRQVDSLIVVARADESKAADVSHALKAIDNVGSAVLGCVFNAVPRNSGPLGSYYYEYRYDYEYYENYSEVDLNRKLHSNAKEPQLVMPADERVSVSNQRGVSKSSD